MKAGHDSATRGMRGHRRSLAACCIAVAALLAPGWAHATPIDLNDFFVDGDVSVSADGSTATMTDSVGGFAQLSNDPFLGDPFVIVPAAATWLVFEYDFSTADDTLGATLFDSDAADPFNPPLADAFPLAAGSNQLVEFDLSPYVGLTLGLDIQLNESGAAGDASLATIRNMRLEVRQVSEPGTTGALLLAGLMPLFLRRRRS